MSKKSKTKKNSKPATTKVDSQKRNFLTIARNSLIGLAIVGGAGGVLAYSANSTMHEQDLTRLGQGTPMVVQVHDPNCPVCQRLQRETKAALGSFSDSQLDYVVANIKSPKGKSFAEKYSVPHITLLLFDGHGELKHILRGPQQKAALEREFRKLLKG